MAQRQTGPHPASRIRPCRHITGHSAIVLPCCDDGRIDWDGFDAHVKRTVDAGLIPAVNMDTGCVMSIDDATRREVLRRTKSHTGGHRFVAGVFVGDHPGDAWDPARYRSRIDEVLSAGGVPVVMQSYGLQALDEERIPGAYREITVACREFIAFELGTMFAPFGRIYDLATYRSIMEIPSCIGAKHSSLDRGLEWQRLSLRDKERPDFMVLTGNDLAIDMVMYGSDYLLGLSTFAPDLFAQRDLLWEKGDDRFYELNDLLQYLGCFAFRAPVPAYKHSAVQFLKIRGMLGSDRPPPGTPARPESDRAVLSEIADRLRGWEKP